ncbi:hypothetical protein KAU55_00185 [Candidatus Bathyarchaeota archaeon]|nr:hypothetical protein [Candidatus Bathyarchaeota archaeon]
MRELTLLEKTLAVTLAVTLILVAATAVLMMASYRIPSVGKIRAIGVEVYSDANCTVPLEFVDWGMLDPGDLAGFTCYIRNSRNVNFTLTIAAFNWTPPEAGDYLFLDWNYSGVVLEPLDVLPVQVTLMVSPDIGDSGVTSFSMDMYILATEVESVE